MARQSTAVAAATDAPPSLLAEYAVAQIDATDLREVMAENLGAGGIGRFDLDRIKVPAGGGTVWSIPTLEGDQPAKEVTGVIVSYADQRAFWREAYGGGNAPPDCSSIDCITGQGDPGVECHGCAFSQFGTVRRQDGSEGRGQACRMVRVLYMILPHSLLPMVISVPPSSLKAVRQYFMRMLSQGRPYHVALTRLKLTVAKSGDGISYSQITPEFAGWLSPEDHARILPLKEMLTAQTRTVDTRDFETAPF